MREYRTDNPGSLLPGWLYATEATKAGEVDMIAVGLLEGRADTETRNPEAADLILVPCPFSIACDCDAGMDIKSKAEALAAGWTRIEYQPEGASCNYMGVCPECAKGFQP